MQCTRGVHSMCGEHVRTSRATLLCSVSNDARRKLRRAVGSLGARESSAQRAIV